MFYVTNTHEKKKNPYKLMWVDIDSVFDIKHTKPT